MIMNENDDNVKRLLLSMYKKAVNVAVNRAVNRAVVKKKSKKEVFRIKSKCA